jgi:hypothetical protein
MVCDVDAPGGPTTQAARGVSNANGGAACLGALHELEQWAHQTEHLRLTKCASVLPAAARVN